MIWRLQTFKKLIKEAYNGVGLTIAKKGTEYIISKDWHWKMSFDETAFQKEYKAAVIECVGELPEAGEIIRAYKGEPNQYELDGVCEWITDEIPAHMSDGEMTMVDVRGYRVVRGSKRLYMVNQMYLSMDREGYVEQVGEIQLSALQLDEGEKNGCFTTNLSTFKFKLRTNMSALDEDILETLMAVDWEREDDEV